MRLALPKKRLAMNIDKIMPSAQTLRDWSLVNQLVTKTPSPAVAISRQMPANHRNLLFSFIFLTSPEASRADRARASVLTTKALRRRDSARVSRVWWPAATSARRKRQRARARMSDIRSRSEQRIHIWRSQQRSADTP